MNYIFSILFFGILAFVAQVIKYFSSDADLLFGLTVAQIIICVIMVIIVVAAFFTNLMYKQEFLEEVNSARAMIKKLKSKSEEVKGLKNYYEMGIMKLYPEHEKQIYSMITSDRPKELIALMENFPELKTSNIIEAMTTKMTSAISSYYSYKREIIDKINDIENLSINRWSLFELTVPTDITEFEKTFIDEI